MVVPSPWCSSARTRTLPHDVPRTWSRLTAPRPRRVLGRRTVRRSRRRCRRPRGGMMMAAPRRRHRAAREADLGVRIEAQFAVGEYEVVVLSATESTGLETWLRRNRYNIPQGAAEYMAPYVREQWKFFVARVDIERAQRRPGGGRLVAVALPLRRARLPAAGAPGAAQRDGRAGPARLHPPPHLALRGGQLPQTPSSPPTSTWPTAWRTSASLRPPLSTTPRSGGGRAVITEYAWGTGPATPAPPPLAQSDPRRSAPTCSARAAPASTRATTSTT